MEESKKNEPIPLLEWQDPDKSEQRGKLREYLFLVKKPFWLKVNSGPNVIAPPGGLVRLQDRFLIESLFFASKIDPIEPGIPDFGEYIAIQNFQVVIDGLYKRIPRFEIVRLDREEAINLLRQRQVRPLDEINVFYIT